MAKPQRQLKSRARSGATRVTPTKTTSRASNSAASATTAPSHKQQRVTAPGLSSFALASKFAPLDYAKSKIRTVPDFPKPGILFRDVTPLLADPRAFHSVIDAFAERFTGEPIDAIVAIESRGFIFGAPLAARLNLSFVPVRRLGKLPSRTHSVKYDLEYGSAELELHSDALTQGTRVVIVDDLLATGGTARATAQLVERVGAEVVAYAFVIELVSLAGNKVLKPVPVVSLIQY